MSEDGPARGLSPAAAVAALLIGSTMVQPAPLAAQGYRAGVDVRFQSVEYRGWALDSIAASEALEVDGRTVSPDGHDVRCRPDRAYCTFYRAGAPRRAGPLVTTARFAGWGLGVQGLSVRGIGRLSVDAIERRQWPGTEPPARLLEGYVEYTRPALTARAGRVRVWNRFGSIGFDGASLEARAFGRQLRASAYGGWGLARGIELPVTSPELDPLDDFRPTRRQLVAGGSLAWTRPLFTGKASYRREFDPRDGDLASEMGSLEVEAGPIRGIRLAAAADYDIAARVLGSSEARASYAPAAGIATASLGVKRYRPDFRLWEIWLAFSPVPYHAVFGNVTLAPVRGLELQGRGEVFWFDESGADSPLVPLENRGWRWSGRAVYSLETWRAMAGLHREFGPGASSFGYEATVEHRPIEALAIGAHARYLKRPLELRIDDSRVVSAGGSLRWTVRPGFGLDFGLIYFDESRERPDASALDWNTLRVQAGVRFDFGSRETSRPVAPAAVLGMPSARSTT